MNLAGLVLRLFGWEVEITVPDYPKVIICVAPHTSNLDFIIGKLAYASVGRRAGFLMKDTWFVFPLGMIFRAMGGIAVPRRKPGSESLVEAVTRRFEQSERMAVAITPEGTRKRTARWRTGFLNIARMARVPIVLGAIDFKQKRVTITDTFTPSGDNEADLRRIKAYYKPFTGKHPEKFTTEEEEK